MAPARLLIVLLSALGLGSCSESQQTGVDAVSTTATVFVDEQRWLTPDAPPFASVTSSVPPGGTVEVALRAGESRRLAYSLQPVSPDGDFESIEWMVLVGEHGAGRTVVVEDFTEIELLELQGPRTDRFRIPEEITSGTWRLCIASTSEPRCSELTVQN